MSHSEGASQRQLSKRPVSAVEKNLGNFIQDNGMSRSTRVSDPVSYSKEFSGSRLNNLDFYDWQPSTPMLENKTKKRNEDREHFQKWQRTRRNYSSSEEGAEIRDQKKINYQTRTSRQLQSREMLSSDLPKIDELFEELSRLHSSLKQASDLLDKIMMLPEPQRSEQRAGVVSIIKQLKEEEHGYKALLRGIMAAQEADENLKDHGSAAGFVRGSDFGHSYVGVDGFSSGDNASKPNNCCSSPPTMASNSLSIHAAHGNGQTEEEGSTVADSEVSVVSLQRHKLRRKLQNLQEKKQQMDDLLEKLQILKSDQELLDDAALSHSVSRNQKVSLSADHTLKDAEQMLIKMETRHKLKKLSAMRDQLQELKTLSQFCQNEGNELASIEGDSEMVAMPDDDKDDDEAAGGGDDDDKNKESEVFEQLLSLLRSQSERMSVSDIRPASYKADREKTTRSEPSLRRLELPKNGASGGETSEMRQLEAATEKLQQLQQLVAMVQQTGGYEMVPKSDFEMEDAEDDQLSSHQLVLDTESLNNREDEEFFQQKMKEQQKELQKLMQEREKLLRLRADLDRIAQDNRARVVDESVLNKCSHSDESNARIRHPLDGNWVSRDLRCGTERKLGSGYLTEPLVQEATQVTFQDPLESVVSNEEVYDQMLWQRLMREEMREKKKDLRGIAQKRSLSNIDGRSEGAATHRSDNFRTSPSEDVTMATWGGSTAGNLESTEENENRSNTAVMLETNGSIRKTEDDDNNDDNEDADDDDDDDDAEDESEEEEDDEDEDENEDECYNDDANDNMNVARAYSRKYFPGNDVKRKAEHDEADCYNNKNHNDKESQTLRAVQESIRSLKGQVTELTGTVQRSMSSSKQESSGILLDQAAQLQQNQLFLSLNQSYFQLVSSQSDLLERFNRLEYFVRQSHNDLPGSKQPSSMSENFLNTHSNGIGDGSCIGHASNGGQPAVASDGFTGPEFPASNLISNGRVSSQPMISYGSSADDEPSRRRVGQQLPERMKHQLLSPEQACSRVSSVLSAAKSAYREDTEDVVIRQQNLSKARAFALEHMASQKVVENVKDDKAFLRSVADDATSVSSVPGSCHEPDRKPTEAIINDEPPDSNINSGFERLSDEIYSEVASLISQNEHCPDFLIQLFRKLQFLSTDFLRQRALFALQNLVSHSAGAIDQPCLTNDSQKRMSFGTEERSRMKKLPDGEWSVGRSSDQSTPSPCSASHWDNPFGRDPLGETVIHFDRIRWSANGMTGTINASSGHLGDGTVEKNAGSAGDAVPGFSDPPNREAESESAPSYTKGESDGSLSDDTCPQINTQQLDQQIKEIMMEVIPVVKEHMSGVFSQNFLQYIQDLVLSLIHQSDHTQPDFVKFFNQQLGTILKDSLAKFEGRKILECDEDLLVDLSEILLNELAFFHLMQNLNQSKAKVKAKLMTWRNGPQSKRFSGFIKKKQKAQINMSADSSSDSDQLTESDLEVVNSGNKMVEAKMHRNLDGRQSNQRRNEKSPTKCLDPELADEDEFVEEDEYYNEDVKFLNDAESIDDSFSIDERICDSNVKIELAPSETKPFTRIGSDEDDEAVDEAASADDPYETAVSRDAQKEELTSGTNSTASLERESCCKQSTEKEEKERDTKEMENVTAEDSGINVSAPILLNQSIECELNTVPDNDQVVVTEVNLTSQQSLPADINPK